MNGDFQYMFQVFNPSIVFLMQALYHISENNSNKLDLGNIFFIEFAVYSFDNQVCTLERYSSAKTHPLK